MDSNLFQNDHITGNSLIGLEFCGLFKEDENILIEKLKDVLNRNINYSNIEYKLLNPTNDNAILIKDGKQFIVKTPMYSYFEAVFILPKVFDFLKTLSTYKDSYVYFKLGFNEDFTNISNLNVFKFILEFNESFVLKNLTDITKDGNIEKLTEIKPDSIEACSELVQKQFEKLKYLDENDETYGISFANIKLGYITFKYAQEINYRNKWEELLKCINHTLITLYNCSNVVEFDDKESAQIEKYNKEFNDYAQSFGCYELFHQKYKSIKLTADLNTDISMIDIVFPSIKDVLFNIVIRNNITNATINYDSDISKLQLKDVDLKKCYHLSGVDIVESTIENCNISNCDIYDTKIQNSTIVKCNLFGYANCKESKFKDCFIGRQIQLTDCTVCGQLGKMAGIMKGGSLNNTTIITDMAELDDKVEKNNVNEIK